MVNYLPPEMLSESALRRVWDDRARHGIDLVSRFKGAGSVDPSLLILIKRQRKLRKNARAELRAALASGQKIKRADKRYKKRTRRFDALVSRYLLQIQAKLIERDFELRVVLGPIAAGSSKQTYRLKSNGYDVTFFASRLLRKDITRAFQARQQGRTELMRALIASLSGSWSKTIVRADVASFYESIPHVQILELVDSNPHLAALSKKWIRQMLASYSALVVPKTSVGLPRGVGPSAALAEAYLASFDKKFSNRNECVFYARYVDDVVTVMAPTEDHDAPTLGYLGAMQDELIRLGLMLSSDPSKVKEHVLVKGGGSTHADVAILGYLVKHDVASGAVIVDFSPKRLSRLSERVQRTFDVYERSKSKEGLSAKLLELRIRFLTSNTRLANSKRDAFVGIRFSNPLINRVAGLKSLDRLLAKRVRKLTATGAPVGVTNRLKRHSFQQGFAETRYVRFSDREWRQITSAWRDLV